MGKESILVILPTTEVTAQEHQHLTNLGITRAFPQWWAEQKLFLDPCEAWLFFSPLGVEYFSTQLCTQAWHGGPCWGQHLWFTQLLSFWSSSLPTVAIVHTHISLYSPPVFAVLLKLVQASKVDTWGRDLSSFSFDQGISSCCPLSDISSSVQSVCLSLKLFNVREYLWPRKSIMAHCGL